MPRKYAPPVHPPQNSKAKNDDGCMGGCSAVILGSWRKHTSGKDHGRFNHTGLSGLSSGVIIFGGFMDGKDTCGVYNDIFHVMLEPKRLQQLAMQVIHKHLDDLPWKLLPVKLISLLGLCGSQRAW